MSNLRATYDQQVIDAWAAQLGRRKRGIRKTQLMLFLALIPVGTWMYLMPSLVPVLLFFGVASALVLAQLIDRFTLLCLIVISRQRSEAHPTELIFACIAITGSRVRMATIMAKRSNISFKADASPPLNSSVSLHMGSFMVTILSIGLAVSLGGPLLYVLTAKRFSLNSLSVPGRLLHWLLAAVVLVIAAYGGGAWLLHIGVKQLKWSDLLSTVVAIIAMLAGAIILQVLITKLGFKDKKASGLQQKIYGLSAPYRFFIVITAAVTEEVLYRGYAIGIGQEVLGSPTIAFVLSLVVFVAAHFTHGAKALAGILWISFVMSLLFVVTGNLFACILAHFVVDALGTLFVPWVASRQRARAAFSASEG